MEEDERSIGKALRSAVGVPEKGRAVPFAVGKVALLSTPPRAALFQRLCELPCASLRELARLLGTPAPTVSWHIRKLVGGDLARSRRLAGRTVFFPVGLVEEAEVPLLAALHRHAAAALYNDILASPGTALSVVRERHGRRGARALRLLKEQGLVTVMRTGRAFLCYPTPLLDGMRERAAKRVKRFAEELMGMLAKEGASPRVVESGAGGFLIAFERGDFSGTLRIPADYYTSTLRLVAETDGLPSLNARRAAIHTPAIPPSSPPRRRPGM